MDAVEFFNTVNRYCKNQGCKKYLACRGDLCMIWPDDDSTKSIEETVSKVEQWAKDHPVKTRQSEFLKMFPKAKRDIDGILCISPCDIDIDCENVCESTKIDCNNCRRKYWKTEVSK